MTPTRIHDGVPELPSAADASDRVPSGSSCRPHIDDVDGPISSLFEIASRRAGQPIFVVYDGMHGPGASLRGERPGRSGTAEIFSLTGAHRIADVQGGLVTSLQGGLLQRVKKMRDCRAYRNDLMRTSPVSPNNPSELATSARC